MEGPRRTAQAAQCAAPDIQHLLDFAKLTMIETLGSDETAVGGFVAAEQIDSQPTVH